jgi:hypothetical protein
VSIMLMEDDRLLLLAREVEQEIESERGFIEAIPMDVWDLVAALAVHEGFDGRALKDMVLHAMHTSLAYVEENALGQIKRLPLSLTQGDVNANVEEFAANPLPASADTNARKKCLCAKLDAPMVVRQLLLLLDAPMSTQLCEKSHAAGATLKRFHQRLGPETAQLRSTLADFRVLYRDSRMVATYNRLEQLFHRRLECAGNKVSSWSLFMSMYLRRRQLGNKDRRAQAFKDASVRYAELSRDAKHTLAAEAVVVRAQRDSTQTGAIADALYELHMHRDRDREARMQEGGSCQVTCSPHESTPP